MFFIKIMTLVLHLQQSYTCPSDRSFREPAGMFLLPPGTSPTGGLTWKSSCSPAGSTVSQQGSEDLKLGLICPGHRPVFLGPASVPLSFPEMFFLDISSLMLVFCGLNFFIFLTCTHLGVFPIPSSVPVEASFCCSHGKGYLHDGGLKFLKLNLLVSALQSKFCLPEPGNTNRCCRTTEERCSWFSLIVC